MVQVLAAGTASLVVTLLEAHSEDSQVLEEGLALLCGLAGSPSGKRALLELGAMQIAVEAMKQHPRAPGLQAEACSVLINLATAGPKAQLLIATLGGLRVMMEALKRHSSDFAVQEKALWGLTNFICDRQLQNQELVIRAGGLAAALGSLRQHRMVSCVQEQGMGFLQHLVVDQPGVGEECVRQGVLDHALEMMQSLPHLVAAAANVWGLVANLLEARVDLPMPIPDLIDVVLDSMRRHGGEAKLMAPACRAFSLLGARCHVTELDHLNGANSIVLEAFGAHHKEPSVHEAACMAVATLGSRGAFEPAELRVASCELIGSIEVHRTAGVVREAACGIVALIEADAPGAGGVRGLFGERNIPGLMCEVLRSHEVAPGVLQECTAALSALCREDSANTGRALASGGVFVLSELLERHLEEEGPVQEILQARVMVRVKVKVMVMVIVRVRVRPRLGNPPGEPPLRAHPSTV